MSDEAANYTLVLTAKSTVAYQTMEFRFEKPKGLSYRAGQSMRLRIKGIEGERTLSILTAPHERDIAFAMRARGSDFKKTLKELEVGETVFASGPYGKFGVHGDETQSAIYIAGGIGITIFISMLTHITGQGLKHPITLFYSNRNEEDISYRQELEEMIAKYPNIRVVFTLTSEKPDTWEGELGYVDEAMLKRHIPDLTKPFFFVSGTERMIDGVNEMLLNLGVPEEHLKTKRFKGY